MSDARIVMLRGVNVGGGNRIAMAVLRDALTGAGFVNVRTHLQSGNVVVDTDLDEAGLAVRVAAALSACELTVPIVSRSARELDAVMAANPFAAEAAENPKALLVTFRREPPTEALCAKLLARAAPAERVAARGRELYSWHPDGIARSKLALALTGAPGEAATSRNWSTVTALQAMAGGGR